jgi:hypothetical protein
MNLRREIDELLAEAKHWELSETTDVTPLVELRKRLAPLIRVTKYQPELGLDAAEALRRTERAIGFIIRRAQEVGELRGRGGRNKKSQPVALRPHEAAGYVESGALTACYRQADASDDVFEEALAICRAAGKLGQGPVVKMIQELQGLGFWSGSDLWEYRVQRLKRLAASNHTSRQIAAELKIRIDVVTDLARDYGIDIAADAVVGRGRRRIDPSKVVEETIGSLEGLLMGVKLIDPTDYDDLDPTDAEHWVKSLTVSLAALSTFKKELQRVQLH